MTLMGEIFILPIWKGVDMTLHCVKDVVGEYEMRACHYCGKSLKQKRKRYHKKCWVIFHREKCRASSVYTRSCGAKDGKTHVVYVPKNIRGAIDVIKLTNIVLDDCIANPRKYLRK